MTEKIKPSKEIISINPDKIDFGNKEVVKDIIVHPSKPHRTITSKQSTAYGRKPEVNG